MLVVPLQGSEVLQRLGSVLAQIGSSEVPVLGLQLSVNQLMQGA